MTKNVYIISGGPGFGKSALISALEKKGFYCGEDVWRKTYEALHHNKDISSPNNYLRLSKVVLKKRIKQYENCPNKKVSFVDRAIPDLIGYLLHYGMGVPIEYQEAAAKYRYQDTVFLTPPWKVIFEHDKKRRSETFEEAVKIHRQIKKVYKSLGYSFISVPKAALKKRVDFILANT